MRAFSDVSISSLRRNATGAIFVLASRKEAGGQSGAVEGVDRWVEEGMGMTGWK